MLLLLIIVGVVLFGWGHKIGYDYGVKVTEQRWFDAVRRADPAFAGCESRLIVLEGE